ncbi:MAG: PepSY domain-containing protein, partial [Nitrososphaeraceae archaeon]
IDAINAAQTNVGANSTVKKAELTPAHGYLVYKIMVVDENMKKYKVIVDPGNGQVLMKKEITWYDEQKMKHGEEKYDKYGHDDQYDKKKMMMMKDKKY